MEQIEEKAIKADLKQLKIDLGIWKRRARIYKDAGLEDKAEQFLKEVEDTENLIEAYEKDLEVKEQG